MRWWRRWITFRSGLGASVNDAQDSLAPYDACSEVTHVAVGGTVSALTCAAPAIFDLLVHCDARMESIAAA